MPRIKDRYTPIDYDAFPIPPETRASLRVTVCEKFTDIDFAEMEAALSLCYNTYFDRKHAPHKEKVVAHLQRVASLSNQLAELLVTTHDPDRSSHDRAVLKLDIVSGGLTPSRQNALFLSSFAKEAARSVEEEPTLSSGQDSAHLDVLLKELTKIFKRHKGLPTGVTTDPDNYKTRSKLAELACDIGKLLPKECRPAVEPLKRRLKLLRKNENRLMSEKGAKTAAAK